VTDFLYWRPVAGTSPALANKMVYMLALPTPAARTTMWQAFSADPEWVKVRDASEKAGPLLVSPSSNHLGTANPHRLFTAKVVRSVPGRTFGYPCSLPCATDLQQ